MLLKEKMKKADVKFTELDAMDNIKTLQEAGYNSVPVVENNGILMSYDKFVKILEIEMMVKR
jgi:CBS domain-containing protein